MTISEAMDVVRALCGKPDVDPILVRFAMDEGRREIERRGNYYWMSVGVDLAVFEDQYIYPITTAVDAGFNLPDYKLSRYAFIKRSDSSGIPWSMLPIGSHASMVDIHNFDAEGQPDAASVDNATMYLSPIPNTLYDVALFYFAWTTNDDDITATDELFTQWPMLIISSALAVLIPMLTKNKEDAAFWMSTRDDEIKKAKDFTNARLGEPLANHVVDASEAARVLQSLQEK